MKLVLGTLRVLPLALAALLPLACWAGPETESFGPAQAIADELKSAAGTDIAWIAAGVLKEDATGDLTTFLTYPTDELVVVKLSGKQIKQALERSVALYPTPNPGFLQVSGLEISFSKSADSERRIRTVLVNGLDLDEKSQYSVAMPGNLARGGLGYFQVWDKTAIERTLPGVTLESVLKGKSGFVRTARWKIVP